jgi:hypothetical protein
MAMRIFLRCVIGLYALAGIIAGVVVLGAWIYWTAVMAGGGDGSGGGTDAALLKVWALGVVVWVLPTLAFIFMLLSSFNRLKGIMHSIGYWYSLIGLLAVTGAIFFFSFHVPVLKWAGLLSLLVTALWCLSFRKGGVARTSSASAS